jgi:hypothetical protein
MFQSSVGLSQLMVCRGWIHGWFVEFCLAVSGLILRLQHWNKFCRELCQILEIWTIFILYSYFYFSEVNRRSSAYVSLAYSCLCILVFLYRERDSDRDGKVNFKEFFHGLFDLVRNYEEESHNDSHHSDNSLDAPAKKLFAQLDQDGDGYLPIFHH